MLAVLIFPLMVSYTSSGLIMVESVSKERAKELGATIRTEMVDTNQVGVWLEFAPTGKLQTFSSVALEIGSGDKRLVSATLSPLKQTTNTVVYYFSTDLEHVRASALTVFYKIDGGWPPYDGFRFNISDFATSGISPDPIGRLVARLSESRGEWQNGLAPNIKLPAS
ncbi:hypothetical protein SBV1_2760011 [Verrucomicrobia bacterium]|nr:hypothetical protein SBV1_2760011 [Verrucomicrobiota bacterium]